MAFPQTPLGVRVDLQLAGVWTNITNDVRVDNGITIRRGRADEASRIDPSECTLRLDNRTGKYSPRNPTSPYYGLLGRNTPLRVGVGTPPAGAGQASLVSSTSLVAPSVTAEGAGRWIAAWAGDNSGGGNITVPAGFTARNQNTEGLVVWRTGDKSVTAGATGTATATFSVAATRGQAGVSIWLPSATAIVEATTPVTLGTTVTLTPTVSAGHYLVVFHGWRYDPDDDMVRPPFLPDAKRPPAWVPIADSGPSAGPRIQAWGLQIDAALAGVLTVQLDAGNSADNWGRTMVVSGPVGPYYPRFTGEVSSWPVTWDLSGKDVSTPITASGVRRRLGTGATPLRSAMYRRVLAGEGLAGNGATLAAYWPMDDAEGARSFGSAVGGTPMTFSGSPQLAADDGFPGSEALATFSAASAKGKVPDHPDYDEYSVGVLVYLPAGLSTGATLLTIQATGTIRTWVISYEPPGLRVEGFDPSGTNIEFTLASGFTVSPAGGRALIVFRVYIDGVDPIWNLDWAALDSNGDVSVNTDPGTTVPGYTIGRVTQVKVGGGAVALNQPVVFGHVFVTNDATFFRGQAQNAVNGYAGYPADTRLRDLAREADILLGHRRLSSEAEMVGAQLPRTLLELMDEAADADGGVLFEPKGFLGFQYRDRVSMLGQTAVATLDYATPGHVGDPLEPLDDDQRTVNDVTVTRIGGASARQEQTTGSLSTAAPPAGVGRYDTSVELSLYRDAQAADRAGWILHLGTVDEARWPTVVTRLEAAPALIPTIAALECGDLVTLTGLPSFVPPGPVDLLLEGYTENLKPFSWTFEGNYGPGSPWRGLVLDSATFGRLDSEGATLAAGATSTAPTISVATAAAHPLWIQTATHPSEFPFDVTVAGEQMTVTAIVGASSPQTFTVTRSVNGVVKSQSAQAQVRLAKPMYVA